MGKTVLSLQTSDSITPITRSIDIAPLLQQHDVVLDFSTAEALSETLPKVVAAKKPLVIGVTGLSNNLLNQIHDASKFIPIFLSSNFSEGIALLKKMIVSLPPGSYTLTETHHTQKKDAPSGTAITLAEPLSILQKRFHHSQKLPQFDKAM